MKEPPRPHVLIVDAGLRQYRAKFYELLREELDRAGIELIIAYSEPVGAEGGRSDTVDVPWAHQVKQSAFRIGRYTLTWQHCLHLVKGADLVIVQQANRRLLNHYILIRQAFGGAKLAFWGHGRNFQATSMFQRVSEFVKRLITRRAHWFFAYNDMSLDVLDRIGYPRDRVTVVNNSNDTRGLMELRSKVTKEDVAQLRSSLGISGDNVGIFVGAMYSDKRLQFLLEACRQVRSQVPDFELICVGGGVDSPLVDKAASETGWIHAVGPKFGFELATHFALARLLLIPGLVGLAVLDSFVFEVPLVTTADALHSPEVSYLENGVNGLESEGDGSNGRYAEVVVAALTDPELYARLQSGCRESAKRYSVEVMAERFGEGVIAALMAAGRI